MQGSIWMPPLSLCKFLLLLFTTYPRKKWGTKQNLQVPVQTNLKFAPELDDESCQVTDMKPRPNVKKEEYF